MRIARMAVLAGLALGVLAGASGAQEAKDKSDSLELRVKFDEESAKGEITCRGGKVKGDAVEFEKCLQDKLDAYEEVAIKKNIIAKEKAAGLSLKKKRLAKKLAFLDSAKTKLADKVSELKKTPDGIEYKKYMGALKKIDEQFGKAVDECTKDGSKDLKCPEKGADDGKGQDAVKHPAEAAPQSGHH